MKKLPPKTMDEAVDRLRAGEKFQHHDSTIFYAAEFCDGPFRCNDTVLNGYWNDFLEWQPVQEWHEAISEENPRLCWISGRRTIAVFVKEKRGDEFFDMEGRCWRDVIPVKPEELGEHSND